MKNLRRNRLSPWTLVTLGVVCAAVPRDAFADEARWVPVVVDQAAASKQTLSLVNALVTALRTNQSDDVVDPEVAARRFEQVHSAAPVEVPEVKLRELGDSFRKALEAAALGQWDAAYELVRSFDELSQPVQDYVTWQLNLSREIGVYCLMSVHSMLKSGREAAAREEMRQCFYNAPKRTLTAKDSPEDVLQLYTKVKAELLAQGQASLEVDVSGAAGAGAGCVVVVNGSPRGGLPHQETELLPVPVRIQVNCQRPGRVHVMTLKPGANSLVVNQRFERVVHTEGYLGLRYADAREEQAAYTRDGLTLAKLLGSTDLLLIRKTPDGRVSVQRLATGLERVLSEVTLAPKASADEVNAAAQALAGSRSGHIVADHKEHSARPAPIDQHDRAAGRSNLYGGVAIAAGSAASLAIAWASYVQAMRFRNEVADRRACAPGPQGAVDALCVQAFAKYSTLGDFTLLFGGLGSALGAALSPAVLPETKAVPVWSWLVGVAGVGAAAAGAVLWSQGDRCSFSSCKNDGLDASLGQLILLQSAPLLAVPITHGVRALLRSDSVEAHASYLPAGGTITLTGNF